MKFFRTIFLTKAMFLLLIVFLPLSSCKKGGDGLVLFSIEHDKKLGKQVAAEIASNPQKYPILSETEYPEAYTYLKGIMHKILSSPNIKYRKQFAYDEVKIIRDDKVLNAFATPGGYIFVYTGLIKFLESEDHLAGVIGHEIAHAEKRHSSKALQREMGIKLLLDIVLGKQKQGAVTNLLFKLGKLKFSRKAETEADENAVAYLSGTHYQCNGVAGFFEKLQKQGGPTVPEFLSTHPSPANRVQNINQEADKLNCNKKALNPSSYETFKSKLP